MKMDRKIKADPHSGKLKTGKKARGTAVKVASKTNGKHLPMPYEYAPIGIVESSLDGKYLNVNQEFCRILGYEKQELIKGDIKDFTYKEDYLIDVKLHEQLVTGEIPFYRFEKRFVRKDGEIIWTELTRSVVRDAKGKVLYVVGTVLDISERKKAESQVKWQAHLLAELADAVLATDENFVLTSWNKAAEQIYGWKAEEVIGKQAQEILQTEFIANTREAARENVRNLGSFSGEVMQRRKDGTRIVIEGKVIAIRDDDGNIQGYVSVNRDITERKRAEDSLRESQQRFAATYENAPIGIVECSLDGKYLNVNEEFCRFLGYRKEELIGHGFKGITHEDDYSIDIRLHQKLVAGEIPFYKLEKRYVRKTGETVWAEITRSPVFGVSGAPLYTIGIMLDISERKHVESALRESAERLRLATESARMFTWEWDFHKRVYTLADNFERVVGFSAGLLSKDTVQSLLKLSPAEDIQAISEGVKQALEKGHDLSTLQYRMIDPASGQMVWLEVSGKIVYDEQGNPERMFGVAQNITENKKVQEEIAIISRMPGENPNPVMRLTREGEVLYANQPSQHLLKIWAQEIEQTVPDELQQGVREVFDSSSKKEIEIEQNGKSFSFTLAPIREAGYVNLYGKDVTERKQIERQLARERELLNRIFESIPVMLTVYEPSTELLRLNSQFEQLIGWKNTEAAGISLMEAIYPDPSYREDVWQFMDRAAENEWMDIQMRTRDGRTLETSWSNIRLSNDMQVGIGIDISERKRAERALAESARRQEALYQFVDQLHRTNTLEDVFTSALDAIINALQCDRASILLYDDTNVMRFVAWRGLSDEYRKATTGHSPWTPETMDPEPICMNDIDTADLSDSLRKVIKTEGIGSLAFIPLVSNGKLIGKFMTYYNASHVFEEEEVDLSLTIARQLAFGIDRKRAEAKLRVSEDRLRLAVEAGNIGIWDIDLKRRDRIWSKEGKAIYGLAEDEFLDYERQLALTHPEDRARLDEAVKAFRDVGSLKQLNIEHRIIRPDGSLRWVEVHGESIYNGESLPVRLIGTIVDITERKRAEEALRIENERFMRFVNSNIVGMLIGDANGKVLLANDYYLNLLGVNRQDFNEGKVDWRKFTPPEWLPADKKAIQELQERGICEPYEKEYVRADGTRVPVYITDAMLPGSGEEIAAFVVDITERKQAEEQLRASEALYRTIARSIPGGGVYVIDKDFRYLVAEGPVSEAFGLSREILEGHTVAELFPPDSSSRMEEHLRRNFAGETISFETKHNGRVYWTQQAPLLGTIGQAIVVTVDITERKQAEEALRQSEERFAQFMHHLPGLAWIKDVQGRYVYANAAAEKAFDTPREELYGKTDEEIFPPEIAAQFRRNDEQALTDERGVQVIETLKQNDGILHSSLVSKFPIPGLDGKPALIGGTAFDITDRLQAEEALRESEERFHAILRQATAGIARKDIEGRLLFINQAFCNMLGYTEAELLDRPMWELMHEEDVAENKQSYARMMEEGVPFKLERRLIRQDGSVLWVDASVSPIMDAEGKPQSAVTVEVDITGRKQAEEALQQLNLQLEDRVLRRTEKLRAVNQTLREEIAERKRVEEALRTSEKSARENEAKLQTLFDLLPVGVSFLSPEGHVMQTNSALTNILKLSKEELLNEAYKSRKYIRANGTPMPFTEFAGARALSEDRTVYNIETGVVLENSEVVWTSVSAAPVDVPDVGAVVATVDITDSKRAEQALRESHERLRILSQRLVEVQEEERRALARELHDRVGQTLAALNINLIIINSQLKEDAAQQIGMRLNDSMKLVAETIALVRDVMTDLRPAVLDDYGLEAALESHITQFMSRYDLNIKFKKPEHSLARLGPSVEMTFLRIAQEALMNIARHARATQVDLSLRQEENAITMTVQDNGTGITSWQQANRPGSHGLTIMRERAEAFGGTLQVNSTPGKGTVIEVSIPYKGPEQRKAQEE